MTLFARRLFGMRALRWGRMLGVLAFIGFMAATYEAMIPDVHDGDAPSATVGDGGTGSHDASGSGTNAPSHGPTKDGQGTQHPVHVDHCGHNHVGSTPTAVNALAMSRAHSTNPTGRHPTLVSITGSSHFRPPIA